MSTILTYVRLSNEKCQNILVNKMEIDFYSKFALQILEIIMKYGSFQMENLIINVELSTKEAIIFVI